MTPIPHSISVDIQKHAKRQVVYMKQGDAMSRELTISFYNDGTVWALPNDVTVLQLAYCKEDFVGGCYDHMPDNTEAFAINTGRTSATMKIHPQVLTVAGNVICELRLLNASAHVLNTFNFVIDVEKSPIAMTSSSEGYYNNVFDGATFTPHVSEAGILSWTNDKNLPNPDPIDLKEFVVDPGDIPVTTMEIVTSEDAVDNVNSDEKLITPAGVKRIVDEYGAQNIDELLPEPIQLTMLPNKPNYYRRAFREFSAQKQYAKFDYCYRMPDNDTYTHFYYCKVNAGHLGDWSDADFTDLGRVVDPTLDPALADVNWNDYLPAAKRGTLKLYANQIIYAQALRFDATSREIVFKCSEQNGSTWMTIKYDVNGALTGCNYQAYGYIGLDQ